MRVSLFGSLSFHRCRLLYRHPLHMAASPRVSCNSNGAASCSAAGAWRREVAIFVAEGALSLSTSSAIELPPNKHHC